jgi:hypothetical protein
MIRGEAVGGTQARTVHMEVGTGKIRVTSGSELLQEL